MYISICTVHVDPYTHITVAIPNTYYIDQLHAQRLLEDPNVKDALLDPDIVKLMEILKTDPNKAQRYM